jgi:hypothetical protein
MDAGLLKKLFGSTPTWHGACVVVVDCDASVKTTGTDSIVAGGVKTYAPRVTSGRVQAEAVCYQPENNALIVVQRSHSKQSTGEELLNQTVVVVDGSHVVGLEFEGVDRLKTLGLSVPPLPDKPRYAAGTLVG